jgi:protein-S-isoprenylcysteine O-methyltransferase Ste14
MVVGYVPYRIVLAAGRLRAPAASAASPGALVLCLPGAVVLLGCVWDFFAAGKGTLAPVDPPRVPVVRGLYRYTGNPMYNGVLAMLAGEAWLFGSAGVFEYALFVLVAFHLFVVRYEKPTLEARFQAARRAVRRSAAEVGEEPKSGMKS